MIGILLITHHDFGRVLLETAEGIMGKLENCETLAVDGNSEMDNVISTIQDRVQALDYGQGVLVLTDMFGGTPSNLSLSLLETSRIEVLTGANLPMLLKAANREDASLEDLALEAKSAGRQGIVLAGEVLNRKVNNG